MKAQNVGALKKQRIPLKRLNVLRSLQIWYAESSKNHSLVIVRWIRLNFCSWQDRDGNDEYQNKFDSILSDLSNNETSEVLNAVNEQELAAKFGTPVRHKQNYSSGDYIQNISLQESIEKQVGSILLQVKVSILSSLRVANAINRDIFDRERFF